MCLIETLARQAQNPVELLRKISNPEESWAQLERDRKED